MSASDFFRPRPGATMEEVSRHNARLAEEAAALERERGRRVAERDRERAIEMSYSATGLPAVTFAAAAGEPGAGITLESMREVVDSIPRGPGRPTYRQLEGQIRRLEERLAAFSRPATFAGTANEIVFGCPEVVKPLQGVPEGSRARLRFRVKKPARVYLRGDSGTSCWYMYDRGLYWEPAWDLASDANLEAERAGPGEQARPRRFRL